MTDLRKEFKSKGYLIQTNFFSDEELKPVFKDIEFESNTLIHKLYQKGLLKQDYSVDKSIDLDSKIKLSEKEFKGTSILLHTTFASKLKESFGSLFSNDKLLNLVEILLDTKDISGHPEWNLRCKTPNNRYFDVPFHQDAAYLEKGVENFPQITVWIALVDIVLENGPLQLYPSTDNTIVKHHLQKSLDPSFKDSWYLEIKDTDLPKQQQQEPITITPISKGSIVIFPNYAIHKSLPNRSDSIRWTVDLRFMKTSNPSGFYPLDESINEPKMKLRSSTQSDIPIDWNQWAPENQDILMDNKKEKDILDEFNYSIEGPWMNRWK